MRFGPLPENERYIALSYNWGLPVEGRYTTKRNTVLNILKMDGLRQYLERLPRTIRETIDLARNLGIHYLWIDSVCIVQDAPRTWERNAEVMDLIYGQAFLTVCAADGDNADAGLRAIGVPGNPSQHTRVPQAIESYSFQLQLMARFPCEVYVQTSKWNTRAWTFQERLLSKRCLIFVGGRVFFQCCTTTLCEDMDMESPISGISLDIKMSPREHFRDVVRDPVRVYRESVALYTARDLTRPTDILAAFCGIGKLLSKQLGGESVFGLLNTHFDWALLWEPQDAATRRKSDHQGSFPSWSWCGWAERRMEYKEQTVSDCMEHLHDWLMNHTWITWYIRDGNGNLRLVSDPKRHTEINADVDEQMQGYTIRDVHLPKYDHYGRKITEHLAGRRRDEFFRIFPDFPSQVRTLPSGQTSSNRDGTRIADWDILQFWTWSAYFYLEAETRNQSMTDNASLEGRIFSRRYAILDLNRTWAGTIVLDKNWDIDSNLPHQLIAVSDARKFWPDEGMKDNEYSMTTRELWPLYNVLLLGYDDLKGDPVPRNGGPLGHNLGHDNGHIARRLGLGKIYKDAFAHSCVTHEQQGGTEWKEIILG